MINEQRIIINELIDPKLNDWIQISLTPNLNINFIEKYKYKLKMNYVCISNKLPEDFIEKNLNLFSWRAISEFQPITYGFAEKYEDQVQWEYFILNNPEIPRSCILKHQKYIDWDALSKLALPEYLIDKYADKLNWNTILHCKTKISYQLLMNNLNYLDFNEKNNYKHFSEDFIKSNQDRVNWSIVSTIENLSESFIDEFANKLNWNILCCCVNLSNVTLNKYKDKLNWDKISKNQKLEKNFIIDNIGKLNLNLIKNYQNVTPEIYKLIKKENNRRKKEMYITI